MNFENYSAKVGRIQDQIRTYSERTAQQALARCANPENPEFRKQVELLDKLTKTLDELNDSMAKSLELSLPIVPPPPPA